MVIDKANVRVSGGSYTSLIGQAAAGNFEHDENVVINIQAVS